MVMRRSTVHALFGAVALAFVALLARETFELQQAKAVNQAVAQARSNPSDLRDKDSAMPPEARLGLAVTLAAAGRDDAAIKQYSRLIQNESSLDLRQAALYDLANLYLRQGMAHAASDSLATLELAKQRYRDLLRANPLDWDARYNLERALRLAPEEASFAEDAVPTEQRQVILPGMKQKDLP
jgi:mxaK protein